MKAERPFARFYYDDFIRDYPTVYADDGALAAWTRLLVVAEKMWPTPAELPRSVKPRALAILVDSRLVEVLPGHGYRIRGHDAERTRRQGSARNAAAMRWQSDSNADAYADAMPRRDETRRDEITPPPAKLGRRKDGTNPRALGTNPRANGASPRQTLAAEKRGGLESLSSIVDAVAARGKP